MCSTRRGFIQSLHIRDISKIINQLQIIYMAKKISTLLFAFLKFPLKQQVAAPTIPEKAKQVIQIIGYKNYLDLQSYLKISQGISIEQTTAKTPHNIIIKTCIKNQFLLADCMIFYNCLALYFSAICV
ncbi:transmembrane protein, putative (macronuclear) [Tetrahymena thermophila SB210]|uniref:Transmembrane protein, putative n=1 Tax=Tetrahymena thermophila (strain SB210) TaxID=312017 RepID=W7XE02_TETTS|nr:transmembrane protein, putative [Tetrahymena thermophila SB210]EWS71074.1 transmembrane protein, putative [Tetrahymena thermophila SB210]|eukprot:XP_012656373.1 transmembrane protein, putative [Tetrahymena thermophila SB210]